LEFYYLGSRYYDAEAGRFISPDSVEYLGANGDLISYNLYAYCSNNPVMYTDPSGHAIITAIILGALIGAGIGFGVTVYNDYDDDGEVFNGSIETSDYIANTLLGGAIGAGAGAIAPTIGSFLSSNFALAVPAVAGGTAVVLNVSGAQIVGGSIGAASLMFASSQRPGDNKKQNQQFRDAMRELNITNKDKMRRVHDKIKGRNMGYNELIEFIKKTLNIM